MKQQVLKALANPSHIFYVPYSLVVLNFVVQFGILIAVFAAKIIILNDLGDPMLLFMMFFATLIGVHFIMMVYSKKDPQLGQIVSAKLRLMKLGSPRKLAA